MIINCTIFIMCLLIKYQEKQKMKIFESIILFTLGDQASYTGGEKKRKVLI